MDLNLAGLLRLQLHVHSPGIAGRDRADRSSEADALAAHLEPDAGGGCVAGVGDLHLVGGSLGLLHACIGYL